MNHAQLHMFRFMITLTLCFIMSKPHEWKTYIPNAISLCARLWVKFTSEGHFHKCIVGLVLGPTMKLYPTHKHCKTQRISWESFWEKLTTFWHHKTNFEVYCFFRTPLWGGNEKENKRIQVLLKFYQCKN